VTAIGAMVSEVPGPCLSSKVIVCTDPLIIVVPDFLPPESCSVLLNMCVGSGEHTTMLDPASEQANWSESERNLLRATDGAIGELTGHPTHDEEPPLSSLVADPAVKGPGVDTGMVHTVAECGAPSVVLPQGLHVDTNGGCPRRFATAILYLTTPVRGQTVYPVAATDGASRLATSGVLPISVGSTVCQETVDAAEHLVREGVLHTKDAKTPEHIAATKHLLTDAGTGTGLATCARQGSLAVCWCRHSDGTECARSWHAGEQVGSGGDSKVILRKFKAMPWDIWDGGASSIAAYVRATREQHKPKKPRITEDGVCYFQSNPYVRGDGSGLTGSVLWDASEALAKLMLWMATEAAETGPLLPVGTSALELGAGTGVVGLTLARLGLATSVVITDREPEILELQRLNIAANGLGSKVTSHLLDFEDVSTYLHQGGDGNEQDALLPGLVLASEVLYEGGHALALAQTLAAHVGAGSFSAVYWSYRHREEAPLDEFLCALATEGFTIERLEDNSGRCVAGSRGTPQGIYAGSHFRSISWNNAADLMRETMLKEQFSPTNGVDIGGDGGIQILRLRRC